MTKKKIFIGIIICLTLIVVLGIMIVIVNNEHENSKLEESFVFNGVEIFSQKYIGYMEPIDIRQKIQELIKVDIPQLYKSVEKMDENALKQYYKENELELKKKFGIQSEEEFIKFGNKIKNTNIDLNSWHSIIINKDSFTKRCEDSDYAYVEFEVMFENENTMKYSIHIANRELMSPQYIFNIK